MGGAHSIATGETTQVFIRRPGLQETREWKDAIKRCEDFRAAHPKPQPKPQASTTDKGSHNVNLPQRPIPLAGPVPPFTGALEAMRASHKSYNPAESARELVVLREISKEAEKDRLMAISKLSELDAREKELRSLKREVNRGLNEVEDRFREVRSREKKAYTGWIEVREREKAVQAREVAINAKEYLLNNKEKHL